MTIKETRMESLNLTNVMFGVIQAVCGAWCVHFYNELKQARSSNDELEKALADHKLHTSENYMTKTELTRAFDTINRSLEGINQSMNHRFDKMDEKLDRKADR
jgi:hypothetical protein